MWVTLRTSDTRIIEIDVSKLVVMAPRYEDETEIYLSGISEYFVVKESVKQIKAIIDKKTKERKDNVGEGEEKG